MDCEDISSLWDELLPGIPDDVALDEIATKISAKDVFTLSLVSPSWRQQIQNRVVYNARVRRRSTETHVILRVESPSFGPAFGQLCLYSLRSQTIHHLPRLPESGFKYQFIALDGKLYVLGGNDYNSINPDVGSTKMFVLDLAGETRWKQCARMLQPRREFACGVMDGKIYVFGVSVSSWRLDPNGASEVYDPELDAWFSVSRMRNLQIGRIVTHVGEELCVPVRDTRSTFQLYHPGKDEWRFMRLGGSVERIFCFDGEIYNFSCLGGAISISIYDTSHSRSWAHRCFVTCDELGPVGGVVLFTKIILPVKNELVANVTWIREDNQTYGTCLLLSAGFGSKDRNVAWRIVARSRPLESWSDFMCLVEL